MKMRRRILTALLLMVASGCASDPFRPYRGGIGYSEVQLAPDLWQIFYEGPRQMSYGQAVGYAQLRAAQVAVREGKPFFEIIDSDSAARIETDIHRDFSPDEPFGRRRHYSPHYGAHFETYADVYQRPTGVLRVRLLTERSDGALDARLILERVDKPGSQPAK